MNERTNERSTEQPNVALMAATKFITQTQQ